MSEKILSFKLVGEKAIAGFNKFKEAHGFKEDWEAAFACLSMVVSLDEDANTTLSFLRNGDVNLVLKPDPYTVNTITFKNVTAV